MRLGSSSSSGGGGGGVGGDQYSFSISSYLPPHTDPRSPPASIQIALRLDGAGEHSILSSASASSATASSGVQIHDVTSPPPARPTASAFAMSALSPSLARLMAFSPTSIRGAGGPVTSTRPPLWSAAATAEREAAMAATSMPPADVDLHSALAGLAQRDREFASSFEANPTVRQTANEKKADEYLTLTQPSYRPASAAKKEDILLEEPPRNPVNQLPITTQSIRHARPSTRTTPQPSERSPSKPVSPLRSGHDIPPHTSPKLSTILSRAEERFARISAQSEQMVKLPSFMSPPHAVPSVKAETISSNPRLLGAFHPRFDNRVDDHAATMRKLFTIPTTEPATIPTAASPLFSPDTSATPTPLSALPSRSFDLGMVAGSPSEEVAELFRRSRGSRRAGAMGPDQGLSSPSKEFELWNLPRQSATRLAQSLQQIDTLPSLPQFVATDPDVQTPFATAATMPQPPNLSAAVSTALQPSPSPSPAASPAASPSSSPLSSSSPADADAHDDGLSADPSVAHDAHRELFLAQPATAALDEADRASELQRQESLRQVVERRKRLMEEERERKRRGGHPGEWRPIASPTASQQPFMSATASGTRRQQSGATSHDAQLLWAVAASFYDQLHSLQRAIAVVSQTPLTALIGKQLHMLEQRIRSAELEPSEQKREDIRHQLAELAELVKSTNPPTVHRFGSRPILSNSAATAVASSTRQSSYTVSDHAAHFGSVAPSTAHSTPNSSRPGSVSGEEEYRYRIAQFHAAKAKRSPPQPHRELATVTEKSSRASSFAAAVPSSQRSSAPSSRATSAATSRQPSRAPSRAPSQQPSREPSRPASRQHSRQGSAVTVGSMVGHSELVHQEEHRRARRTSDGELLQENELSEIQSEAELLNDSSMEEHDAVLHPPRGSHADVHNESVASTHAATMVFVAPKKKSQQRQPKSAASSGMNLTTREVRALVRSEVLGSAQELMATYAYLPPPRQPIPLTRTQMLREAARKQRGEPPVKRRVFATAPVVRRNIQAMLQEELAKRKDDWTKEEPEIEDTTNHRQHDGQHQQQEEEEEYERDQVEDDPQPRVSPPRPSPSSLRQLDDLLAVPSRLTAPIFSPPRTYQPPPHGHIDVASFAELPRTQSRATPQKDLVEWKDQLARNIIEEKRKAAATVQKQQQQQQQQQQQEIHQRQADERHDAHQSQQHAEPPMAFSSSLLTPFTSDSEIDAHLKQLFSGAHLHLKPIEPRRTNNHDRSTRESSASFEPRQSNADASTIDSPTYSSSFVSSGASSQMGDDVGVMDQIDALQHLSSSAIVFPPPTGQAPAGMQQHLELRPVGVILGPTPAQQQIQQQ